MKTETQMNSLCSEIKSHSTDCSQQMWPTHFHLIDTPLRKGHLLRNHNSVGSCLQLNCDGNQHCKALATGQENWENIFICSIIHLFGKFSNILVNQHWKHLVEIVHLVIIYSFLRRPHIQLLRCAHSIHSTD